MHLTQRILELINNGINNIEYLKVIDITNQHADHLPEGVSETHFNVTVISNSFYGLSLIARHQKIYKLLKHELTHGIHALSLSLYTINEYENKTRHVGSKSRTKINRV